MSKTTVFYSGCEGKMHYRIASENADNVLLSYYYIQKQEEVIKLRKKATPRISFMIDSGAHTLQKGEEQSRSYWEKFLERYVAWLHANRDYVYCAVELDVGNIVGEPIIQTWRERYFQPLEAEGMQIIYVWHDYMGEAEWVNMCQKYRYVGVGQSTYQSGRFMAMLQVARRYRTKVHGFAITAQKALKSGVLATADSTSWKSGERYGVWLVFTGKSLRVVAKESRPNWEHFLRNKGYDYELLMEEDAYATSTLNIREFRQMENYYNDKNAMYGSP